MKRWSAGLTATFDDLGPLSLKNIERSFEEFVRVPYRFGEIINFDGIPDDKVALLMHEVAAALLHPLTANGLWKMIIYPWPL